MSLIGSSSAQMLLLMLLPLFVFQQSSAASIARIPRSTSQSCVHWNGMHEFYRDLNNTQSIVNSCNEECSSAGVRAECQCINISESSEKPFPCYFAEWLGHWVFSGHERKNLIKHLERGCKCESVNKILCPPKDGPVSPKTLLRQLKECVEQYKTDRS